MQENARHQPPTVNLQVEKIAREDSSYPAHLVRRMGKAAPSALTVLGNVEHLALPKIALFCSSRCPGDRILRIHEHVQQLRDREITVISGFHSPVEKECLRILLRGSQPIIICPARTLTGMAIPASWQRSLDAGRLLLLSIFPPTQRRASVVTANRRNEFVAALADEIFVAHATPSGHLESLERRLEKEGRQICQLA